MSSGTWAGEGAAKYAALLGDKAKSRNLQGAGRAAIRPTSTHKVEADDVIKRVQKEVFPFDKNYFRSEPVLNESLEKLDALWLHVQGEPNLKVRDIIKHRESVSLVANARWAYRSALHRTESRGMHKRVDRPDKDPSQQRRLLSGGLDEVWTEFDRNDPLPESISTPVREAIAV
jgi:succinate dehydrogenase/fumarate reductase flavoprotein subunit